jgi:hypothetical protein
VCGNIVAAPTGGPSGADCAVADLPRTLARSTSEIQTARAHAPIVECVFWSTTGRSAVAP